MANARVTKAAHSFAETLVELGIDGREEEFDATVLGRRAAVLVTSDLVWRKRLGRLLEGREVQEILNVSSRQAVHDLVRRGRLLALRAGEGRLLYPVFQFDVGGRRAYPEMVDVLEAFADAASPLTIASWFVEPQPELEEQTPADWMHARRDPELLTVAAEHAAAPLAH